MNRHGWSTRDGGDGGGMEVSILSEWSVKRDKEIYIDDRITRCTPMPMYSTQHRT